MINFLRMLTQMGMMFNDTPEIGSAILAVNLIFISLGVVTLLLIVIPVLSLLVVKNKIIRKLAMVLIVLFSVILLSQIGLYAYMAYIEPNQIKVEEVNLKIPGLGNVLQGKRIVQFSDLHVRQFGTKEKRLIKIINSLNPDIILFTGGFTGEEKERLGEAMPQAAKIFSSLKAKIGIWAVTDDTDDLMFIEKPYLKEELVKAGVKLLFNTSEKIYTSQDGYFWLIGTEDAFYGNNGLPEATFMIPLREPKIIITHSPNAVDYMQDYKVDLVLAGKTHGGQIGLKVFATLSNYIAKFKYLRGLYKMRDTYLYVNRGIGGKTINLRLFCPPEVTVFNITD
ncbi:MAG: hypothetical protein A2166_00365 [Omnitrophica WOR_2 bacterium RBG_13_41_10]|nr:MAG: hypothetical protein A2166_00365 [Omnitrophica WOR_2 bacterium RBG_13_41_10]